MTTAIYQQTMLPSCTSEKGLHCGHKEHVRHGWRSQILRLPFFSRPCCRVE